MVVGAAPGCGVGRMAISGDDRNALPRRHPQEASGAQRESLFAALARPVKYRARTTTLWAIYAVEVSIVALLRVPHDLALFSFAFGDRGSWLVVQYLTAHGYRPTIDFGFPYGLLPVMAGGLWFRIFGLTPAAFELAMVAGGLAMAWGMARFAGALPLGRIGHALIIIGLPVAIQSSLPSLSHLLEAVLLTLALGEHARGNRRAALALATAGCFAKPALGYLYGILLLASIIKDCRLSGARFHLDGRAIVRALMPAAAVGVTLLLVLGARYGVRPLVSSVLPLNGMRIYRANHFGFFTPWSRTFWLPAPGRFGDYFGTIAPFWVGSTIVLALAAAGAGWRLSGTAHTDTRWRDEVIFCCGVMQAIFVIRMFGPPASWTYYPYLLIVGMAALSTVGVGSAMLAAALTTVMIAPQAVYLGSAALQWKLTERSPVSAGLWAGADERAEWATVERLIAGHRAVAVGVAGCAPLIAPNFAPPIGAYLVVAEATPEEVARTIARVRSAEIVVRPAAESIGDPVSFWPELTRALNDLEVVWQGRFYKVCRRKPNLAS